MGISMVFPEGIILISPFDKILVSITRLPFLLPPLRFSSPLLKSEPMPSS